MLNALKIAEITFVPTAAVFQFNCCDCDAVHHGMTPTLPAGWHHLDYAGVAAPRCGDCADRIEREHGLAISVQAAPEPLAIDQTGWAYVDGDLQMLRSGCNVAYWPMPEVGGAVLHIRAGNAGGTPGELLALDHGELSILIDELQRIQSAITPAPAPVRGGRG